MSGALFQVLALGSYRRGPKQFSDILYFLLLVLSLSFKYTI